MTEVYRKIKVDVSRQSNARVIFARQNDIGARNMIIEICDNGAPYHIDKGVTASVQFKRPDGLLGAIYGEVGEDGKVHVGVAQIMIKVVGTVECAVSLFDADGNVLTSSNFYIEVTEQFYSGDTMGDDPDYELLQEIFVKLSGYEVSEAERVESEKKRADAETSRAKAEEEREKKSVENLGVMGEATLLGGAWSQENTQTIRIAGLRENDLVTVFPASRADGEKLINYGIFVHPDTSGESVTVSSRGAPDVDIFLRYFITRGRAYGGGD